MNIDEHAGSRASGRCLAFRIRPGGLEEGGLCSHLQEEDPFRNWMGIRSFLYIKHLYERT